MTHKPEIMPIDAPKKRKGFTMTEMIAAIAILAVLAAIAIPSAIAISRRIELSQLDDGAHSIFIAAQSKLASMTSAGIDLSYLSESLSPDGDGEFYAITKDSDGMKDIILPGAISSDLAQNNYVLEVDKNTGGVYAVWYWEDEAFDYLTQAYSTVPASYQQRLSKNVKVGYYGGSSISRPTLEQSPEPKIEVVDFERLILKISISSDGLPFGETVELSVKLIDESNASHTIINRRELHVVSTDDLVLTIALDSSDAEADEKHPFEEWPVDGGFLSIERGEKFYVVVEAYVAGTLPTTAKTGPLQAKTIAP